VALSFLTTPCRAASAGHAAAQSKKKGPEEEKENEGRTEGRSCPSRGAIPFFKACLEHEKPFTYRVAVWVKGTL